MAELGFLRTDVSAATIVFRARRILRKTFPPAMIVLSGGTCDRSLSPPTPTALSPLILTGKPEDISMEKQQGRVFEWPSQRPVTNVMVTLQKKMARPKGFEPLTLRFVV